jgi:hypothetical protein
MKLLQRAPPSGAEVKEWVKLCLHSPNTSSWHGAQLNTETVLSFSLSQRCARHSFLSFFLPLSGDSITQWYSDGLRAGWSGSESRQSLGIYLFTTASRPALDRTYPPIQWVPAAFLLWVKQPGRESDHSPPSSAEVKEWVELYHHSPNTHSWRGAQLKHKDNFTFT